MDIDFIKKELDEMKQHISNVWDKKEDISLLDLYRSISIIEENIDKKEEPKTNLEFKSKVFTGKADLYNVEQR